ncbi:MAG: PilC/PilY family type IV pilus protein [Oleiphilaceae bacterium]|nr:PilC/PilY family type IV pilus protein [Oleiphilaceae bacterium]
MNTHAIRSKRLLPLVLCLLGLSFGSASQAQVELSDFPLFVSSTADPNILFLLDDSGSMRFGYIPDGLSQDFNFPVVDRPFSGSDLALGVCQRDVVSYAGTTLCPFTLKDREFLASPTQNAMYFDPDRNYPVPFGADGQPLSDPIDFNNAPVDGYKASDSVKIDLSTDYMAIIDDFFHACIPAPDKGSCSNQNFRQIGFTVSQGGLLEGAFYYRFNPDCTADNPLSDDCYERVSVVLADSETKQNFANWFSFYRTRILATRAGITASFLDQPSNLRIGYDSINNSNASLTRGVRPFSGTDRAEFFSWLQGAEAVGPTPLRRALRKAGDYFDGDPTDTGPWASNPGVDDDEPVSEFAECRQSFSILMTDGAWNGDSQSVGNVDGEAGSPITGPGGQNFDYEPVGPFADEHSETLADIAMNYWNRDLQPDIINRIPDTRRNPAFWQHMITYGVGLGVEGSVDPAEAFNKMLEGGDIAWQDPAASNTAKIDDLLHAGVNSRGGFFNVQDPRSFSNELAGVLGQISEAVGSSTGVTFDTATLEEDSLIFAARFDSARWKGDLDARPLITNDDEPDALPQIGEPVWSAADKLDVADPDLRRIITMDGAKGVPFRWSTTVLSERHKADLRFGASSGEEDALAESRVAYLRGDRSLEGLSDGFRRRDSRLGDIVNSTPVRVSSPGSGWPDTGPFGADDCDADGLNCNRYSDFRAREINREPIIYAGANDGMLHGFRANDADNGGEEVLAYMPLSIFSDQSGEGLHHLTNSGYSHKFYVDLPPLVADAFVRGRDSEGNPTAEPDWRTLLLGGPRFGARSIFALDVTDPTRFSEANAAELALWEFSDEDDPRLGFITQPPIIALAPWGNNDLRWTAFVANGYNSPTAATGFFMLDLEGGLDGTWTAGSDYRFIQFTGSGPGLSPLAVYDLSGDRIVDRIYAGDREGRIWVAESSGNQGFVSAYTSGNTPVPLFTAERDGVRQPITASPLVIPNRNQQPSGSAPDLYVIFGTGQFLNEGDLTDTRQQSLYAVRDVSNSQVVRGDLAQRQLSEVQNFNGTGNDVLFSDESSSGPGDSAGWFVDLFAAGERITLPAQVRGEFIFVNTAIPSDNPCVAGGASRAMAFGLDGLTPTRAVFTAMDEPVVAYKLNDGIPSQSAFLGDYRFTPTSVGNVVVEGIDTGPSATAIGRQGWQELIE